MCHGIYWHSPQVSSISLNVFEVSSGGEHFQKWQKVTQVHLVDVVKDEIILTTNIFEIDIVQINPVFVKFKGDNQND